MSQHHAKDWRPALMGLLRWAPLLLLTATIAVSLTSCLPQDTITDPCEEECNDDALVGDPCGAAEDCATGSFCNLGFPGGYCQHACTSDSVGEACGPNEAGVCISVPDNEDGASCVAACDPSSPDTCGRAETACYALPDGSGGMCNARCITDADCLGGMACDGVGLCRSPVAVCDGMTGQGCPAGQNVSILCRQAIIPVWIWFVVHFI